MPVAILSAERQRTDVTCIKNEETLRGKAHELLNWGNEHTYFRTRTQSARIKFPRKFISYPERFLSRSFGRLHFAHSLRSKNPRSLKIGGGPRVLGNRSDC